MPPLPFGIKQLIARAAALRDAIALSQADRTWRAASLEAADPGLMACRFIRISIAPVDDGYHDRFAEQVALLGLEDARRADAGKEGFEQAPAEAVRLAFNAMGSMALSISPARSLLERAELPTAGTDWHAEHILVRLARRVCSGEDAEALLGNEGDAQGTGASGILALPKHRRARPLRAFNEVLPRAGIGVPLLQRLAKATMDCGDLEALVWLGKGLSLESGEPGAIAVWCDLHDAALRRPDASETSLLLTTLGAHVGKVPGLFGPRECLDVQFAAWEQAVRTFPAPDAGAIGLIDRSQLALRVELGHVLDRVVPGAHRGRYLERIAALRRTAGTP